MAHHTNDEKRQHSYKNQDLEHDPQMSDLKHRHQDDPYDRLMRAIRYWLATCLVIGCFVYYNVYFDTVAIGVSAYNLKLMPIATIMRDPAATVPHPDFPVVPSSFREAGHHAYKTCGGYRVKPTCLGPECSWDDFFTLGFCSTCEDISHRVSKAYVEFGGSSTYNFSLPGGLSVHPHAQDQRARFASSMTLIDGMLGVGPVTIVPTTSKYIALAAHDDGTGATAVQCSIGACIKHLSARYTGKGETTKESSHERTMTHLSAPLNRTRLEEAYGGALDDFEIDADTYVNWAGALAIMLTGTNDRSKENADHWGTISEAFGRIFKTMTVKNKFPAQAVNAVLDPLMTSFTTALRNDKITGGGATVVGNSPQDRVRKYMVCLRWPAIYLMTVKNLAWTMVVFDVVMVMAIIYMCCSVWWMKRRAAKKDATPNIDDVKRRPSIDWDDCRTFTPEEERLIPYSDSFENVALPGQAPWKDYADNNW